MPLSGEWDQLESFRRKKWLGIAQRYPSLPASEQQRVQHRMKAWINLSPGERQRVRDLYKNLQKAPPEQRASIMQKWQEYKELPDAEKERLRKLQEQTRTQPKKTQPGTSSAQRSNTPSVAHPAPLVPSTSSAGVSVTPLAPVAPTGAPLPIPASADPQGK
ncbi:MAG: DUF3106 domain-containing protein [Sterolibacterium sp.]|jgi:hypothetical protein|nr:DUF3106 domain-containing protein [Sterolibacterium sp.]